MGIKRRRSRKVKVGRLYIGGGAPISIQSMVKADTKNLKAAVDEIRALEKAGCEIVRVAVKDKEAAAAIRNIKRKISLPLAADIHFNPELAMLAIKNGADKVRINPGNISDKAGLVSVLKTARKKRVPIRIGLNSGSIPRGANMSELAKRTIKLFEAHGFYDIIISLKDSDVSKTIEAYRSLAAYCDYPFHVGTTATGIAEGGIVKSSIAIGGLLLDGIGDTIRVSLTAGSVDEVKLAKIILSSLKLRNFGPEIISCPTCGRCQVDLVRIVRELNRRLSRPQSTDHRPQSGCSLRIAVMGCEVNGPGEARDADIGIAAGKGSGVLFKKGRIIKRIKEKDFVKTIIKEIKNTDTHR